MHNPEVEGSNPSPAISRNGPGNKFSLAHFILPQDYDPHQYQFDESAEVCRIGKAFAESLNRRENSG